MVRQAGFTRQYGEAFLLSQPLRHAGDAESRAIDLACIDAYRSRVMTRLSQRIEIHARDAYFGGGLGGDHGVAGLAREEILLMGTVAYRKNRRVFAGALKGVHADRLLIC